MNTLRTVVTERGKTYVLQALKLEVNDSQIAIAKVNRTEVARFRIAPISDRMTKEKARNVLIEGLKEELKRQSFRVYEPRESGDIYRFPTYDGMKWEVSFCVDGVWRAFCHESQYVVELTDFVPTKSITDCAVMERMIENRVDQEGS